MISQLLLVRIYGENREAIKAGEGRIYFTADAEGSWFVKSVKELGE